MFLDDEDQTKRLRERRKLGHLQIVAATALACLVSLVGLTVTVQAQSQPTASQASSAATTEVAALVRPGDMNMGGLLLPSKEPGFFVEAPRLKTDVAIDVAGPIARVKLTQRFQNPSKGWVEGTYVFPLPENSAVDSLRMQIGDRFIEGKLKPREEARQIYEQAKTEGKKAALLEQQRPNIFTNQVANIGPGDEIVVQIEYQQAVHQSQGEFSLRFPMVVAPRYNPQPIVQSVEFNGNAGFAISPDPVENREKIEAPVLDPKENAKINPVALTVSLKSGFPLGEVKSSYHDVTIAGEGDQDRRITLKTESVPADKDFELTWRAAPGASPHAGLFREVVDGKTYLMAFVTPPAAPAQAPAPREVVFVIDNSGSMAGASIEQARKSLALAISRLKPTDRFSVIRFDDTMTDFFGGLVPATGDNREKAVAYVNGLTADGGTEMLPALLSALRTQGPKAPDALRQIVFLTDGAIGNESQLFDAISDNRGDARVFTVGIGSAPNSYFMSKAAEIGRGTFTQIGTDDQIAERMAELFTKLENPVMTDIAASFDGANATEITPNPMPDLYAGEPVILTAEIEGAAPQGKLQILGRTADQPWRVEMDIAKAADGRGISKLWARRKIDDIEARAYRAANPEETDRQVEQVAMVHGLVSRMTSLVAVDVTPSRPSDEPVHDVKLPLNLPDGWDFEKVMGEPSPSPMPINGQLPSPAMQEASAVTYSAIAAAPTAKAAAVVAQNNSSVALPQTATLADQRILMGLIFLAFAAMAIVCLALWRRGLRDVINAESRRRGR
ncbi:marine proteobacterial sortase target protein [Rhizobium sp. RU36D]|uniref:marine proteobacterial sortase target protein n=1 Tax=Rhizobium sp. RU36D TaxID=1907415 RepID=UPI0009D7B97C|nr:marine proteobacterial sortase target protein [Rhizobium sp. RU36D]SMC61233.1 Ca-activated chloride channel family protein [Rhizobium sp. RU36D]